MFLPCKQLSIIIIMDFEYDINGLLKHNYMVYSVIVITLVYVFFRLQNDAITKFVDSIYGRAILLFLLLWLLTEEHYTISICIIIAIISTLYWIREKRDYELVKYTINNEKQESGKNKCSRDTVQYTEAEREVPGPENSMEFFNV